MRTNFDKQLNELNEELTEMGAMCETAISTVADVLLGGDTDMLGAVHETAAQIDQMEHDVEEKCLRLILRQQPVARDLRTVSSALKMVYDIHRIGDQAADVADIMQFMDAPIETGSLHIGEMAHATIKMVNESIDSFVQKDYEKANGVVAYDDVVDDLFDKVKCEITELIRSSGADAQMCLDLLMTAKYFERIGDHAVNIAEWVKFSITGKHDTEQHTAKKSDTI